jgi:hypothetical protein
MTSGFGWTHNIFLPALFHIVIPTFKVEEVICFLSFKLLAYMVEQTKTDIFLISYHLMGIGHGQNLVQKYNKNAYSYFVV